MLITNADLSNIRKPFVAMYGGSFNPIHTGHIQLAQYFVSELGLEKLLLVPDNTPPHKSSSAMVSPRHRYNMCLLAAENLPKIEVSDIELKRQGKSYTVDTLIQLSEIYKNSQLFLIMGADMFLSLTTWKNFREIFKLAVVCAVPRDSDHARTLSKYGNTLEKYGCKYVIADEHMMNVSSTEIRENIKLSKSINGMVCPRVSQYIYDNSLYMG